VGYVTVYPDIRVDRKNEIGNLAAALQEFCLSIQLALLDGLPSLEYIGLSTCDERI